MEEGIHSSCETGHLKGRGFREQLPPRQEGQSHGGRDAIVGSLSLRLQRASVAQPSTDCSIPGEERECFSAQGDQHCHSRITILPLINWACEANVLSKQAPGKMS